MTVRQRLAGWAFTIGGKLDPDFDPWGQGEPRPDPSDAAAVIGFPLENAIKQRAGVDLATGRDRTVRTSIHVPTGLRIHLAEDCHPPCAFHAPSPHHMKDWPLVMRATGLVERVCRHEVGHPDPDSVRYLEEHGPTDVRGTWGMHGCDGCCRETSNG